MKTSVSTPSGQSSSGLLAALLDIAVAKGDSLPSSPMSDIANLAKKTVRDALGVMSAADFISGVSTALDSKEATVSSKFRSNAYTHLT